MLDRESGGVRQVQLLAHLLANLPSSQVGVQHELGVEQEILWHAQFLQRLRLGLLHELRFEMGPRLGFEDF